MIYRVEILQAARADLHDAYLAAARHAPDTARRWADRFLAALGSLASNPRRCEIAVESRKADRELRFLLFGRRANKYRAIFTIDGDTVLVLRIRRAQRKPLTRREIDGAFEDDDEN